MLLQENRNDGDSGGSRSVLKSPFFKPSSTSHGTNSSGQQQYVVVQQATPRGTHIHSRSIRTARSEREGLASLEHKSTIFGACSNLVNAIVGCGIVGIPYALKQSGFVAGIVLILVSAMITEKSLRLLINTAKHVHVSSYETAMEAVYGITGFRWIAISMFIVAYGGMISYLMIIKDTFSSVLRVDSVEVRRSILLVVSCLVTLPLSCKRDMADLAFTSRISVVIDTALVGLILYSSPTITQTQVFEDDKKSKPTFLDAFLELIRTDTIQLNTIFIGLGVLSFAFVCQHSAFIIAGSLAKPTVKRWSYVTHSAVSLCTLLTLFCGIAGYIGYRDNTVGNILLNLDPESMLTKVAKLSVGISMLFVYPLDSFVSRHVLVVLFFQGRSAHEGDDAAILNRNDRRYILTLSLFAVAVIPAALCENLGTVLAITGAVGGSCLSYIGPGILYLGVHGDEFIRQVSSLFSTTESEPSTIDSSMPVKAPPPSIAESSNNEATPLISSETSSTLKSSLTMRVFLSMVILTFKNFAWYCLGMPVWCAIAKSGSKGLQTHVHEMALKSPYPIRIGDVEYKRVMINLLPAPAQQPPRREMDEEFNDEEDRLLANASSTKNVFSATKTNPTKFTYQDLSLVGGLDISLGIGDINQQIGKNLLEKKNQKKGMSKGFNVSYTNGGNADDVEPDPQEGIPTWSDFIIAIFYIVFGLIAMTAGIVSLFCSQ